MSVFDIFSKAAPAPAPIQQPAAPTPVGTAKVVDATPSLVPVISPGTAPNGMVPNNVVTEKSPLDPYATLWDTDPNIKKPGEYVPQQLDAGKLQEVVSKVDMTKVITPAQMAAINAGGEGATAALMASLNAVAQQTLLQSTVVANKMIESAVAQAITATTAKIPALMKELNLSNSLIEKNPIFSNPAVKPVIEAVKSQLSTKFPNATTQELTSMAQDFVKAMGESFSPKPAPVSNPNEFDWSSYLENQ